MGTYWERDEEVLDQLLVSISIGARNAFKTFPCKNVGPFGWWTWMLPLSSSDVLELLGCSIRMAVRRHHVIDFSNTRKVLDEKDDSAIVQSVYVLCKGNIVLFLYTLPSVKRNIHIFTAFFFSFYSVSSP